MINLSILNENRKLVNKWISDYFLKIDNQTQLYKAIKYGVSNGGKRLRPLLTTSCFHILNKQSTLPSKAFGGVLSGVSSDVW